MTFLVFTFSSSLTWCWETRIGTCTICYPNKYNCTCHCRASMGTLPHCSVCLPCLVYHRVSRHGIEPQMTKMQLELPENKQRHYLFVCSCLLAIMSWWKVAFPQDARSFRLFYKIKRKNVLQGFIYCFFYFVIHRSLIFIFIYSFFSERDILSGWNYMY